jgi:hypothetical protein
VGRGDQQVRTQFGGLSSLYPYGGPYQQAVNAEWLRAYPLFLGS